MSTTSQNEDKADGTPDPADSEKTVKGEAVPAESEEDRGEEAADKAVAGKPTLTPAVDETVIDAPWTVAAEPSDSVFADRAPAPGATAAMPTVTDGAPSPEPKSPLPPQPSTDRPVASAASAAAALASRLGRQLTGDSGREGDEEGKDGKSSRKAHLQIARFEPWTVMKFSFVMSLVCFVVLFVAVTVLYMVLSGLGVFDSISEAINETTNGPDQSSDAGDWFSAGRILGYTALLGALNVLLITALATVGSVIYNLAAEFVGGVEVTLKEAE
ncbi:DUF3566 domain-containing protein [Actinocorallia populi]|uniref:DUF3566 domain-containing protein n=1 Tax=Actinocorallia populi TaxID=2079200 RepID=UPI001E46671A|nr:DUF3566 domain-containing protein [Actinocorallia populi]